MKKALKILKIVGITLGVIIILLIVVPFFIPADTYKKLIVEQAEKQVSGKIEIGSMRLRILPWPGFILRDIKVSNNADTFKDQTIVAAGKIAIDLQLKPLLDKMVVASLELIKPEV
ncbi:AsmA family protein, partial [bacterium]|nr:AsmA family protein [bacterium]